VSLFVDTSVWYAAADRGDRHNGRAIAILSAEEDLITSDHVLVESWPLLHHRLGLDAAERFWDGLRNGVAQIEHVGAADLEAAWAIGEVFADQDFSIVDRTSFAVMQRLGVHRAAAFDDDFAVFRFGTRRDRSFTVVR
jgi:predicted nucleic acid-binding protein